VYPRYSLLFPTLKEQRDSLDRSYMEKQKEVEDKALLLQGDAGIAYLTQYSSQKAVEMLNVWKNLAIHLIVKYNDMIIKPEADGQFLRTPEGLGQRVVRPGYSERFARELIKQTGTKFEVPNEN
jgi:hypothetical protein